MKTIKIAVIAMMGTCLGVKAQEWNTKGDNSTTGSLRVNNFDIENLRISYGNGSASWIKYNHLKDKTFFYTNSNSKGMFFSSYGQGASIRFQTGNTWNDKPEASLLIANDGNVGIGTTSPRQKLELYNSSVFNNKMEFQSQDHLLLSSSHKKNGEFFGGITWESGGRRRASIVATREHNDADHVGMAFFTKGTDGPGAFFESMRISHRGNVGIGTTKPSAKLSVNGKIHTKEVRVDLKLSDWSDFVFYDNYNLPTLEEVENHIKEKGHLKNIPSAMEVDKNGIYLGEMDAKLLQKIEELTLYTIAQEKEIKELKKEKAENEKQNFKIEEQEKKIEKLELLVQQLLKDRN